MVSKRYMIQVIVVVRVKSPNCHFCSAYQIHSAARSTFRGTFPGPYDQREGDNGRVIYVGIAIIGIFERPPPDADPPSLNQSLRQFAFQRAIRRLG